MPTLRVHVHGMDCAEEAALVRRALASNAAIQGVEFDLIHGTADVAYDGGRTTEEAVLAAVRSTGLKAHALAPPDTPAAAPVPLHGEARHTRVSHVSTMLSGALFLLAWLVEGLASEHWLDTFTHEHGSASPAAVTLYAASALAGLWPMWPRAIAAVRHLRLDMHALVCLTVLGAALLGQWSEGAAVAFLFALAHRMESWSLERARTEIAALVGRGPALIAEGLQQSAPTERWIERFAAVYTPVVVAVAVAVAMVPPLVVGDWSTWFYRALVFLVLACPCALVISTPVTVVAALSAAARRGVLIKGGAVLERAATAAAPTPEALAAIGITVAGARAHGDRVASADVVLTASSEQAIALLVGHSRRAVQVIRQNVAVSLLTKLAFLVSAAFGAAPLWLAVLADTGATVIVTLNALRMLRVR